MPACGAFEMTEDADDLKNYFKLGEEIVVYNSDKDLVEKVRYSVYHSALQPSMADGGAGAFDN